MLASLRVEPEMHHIAWMALSTDIKVDVDATLRRLKVIAESLTEVSS